MNIYFFHYQNEWYFTEGVPTDKTPMSIFYTDEDGMHDDADRYQYIRGWTNKELETMFLPLDNGCVVT
jgi:hypothetical protein